MRDPDPLERFVDHLTRGFTPELAQRFAELPRPDPELQAHLDELAAKANEGRLTDEERGVYEKLVDCIDLVAYIRLRARSRAGTSAS